ncbi:MAG: MBL fold metallo-hydrolase [Candidatus Promineifilaceae bacterium]|nr:MBL fold metallo-hydrolase [Candidatus Promineifilaceae bacterium]
MIAQELRPGIYQISLGIVNVFLLDTGDLTLIDTGVPGSEEKILAAVREIGRKPTAIRQILVTHLHADHSGSLAAVKEASGAPVMMHQADAEMVRKGISSRPSTAAPGLINKLIVNLVMARRSPPAIDPVPVEEEIKDGQILEQCGGLQVIHVPGHSAGQVAFYLPNHGGILFAADAASHMMGLGYPPIFEDLELGLKSLKRLAKLDFQTACFGHGKAITKDASARFRNKWD